MKKNGIIITATVVALILFSAFGFSDTLQGGKTCTISSGKTANNQLISTGAYAGIQLYGINIDERQQTLFYSVKSGYKYSITDQQLKKAKLITEVIPNFPINWISDYKSVEIVANNNGIVNKAIGPNEKLTKEQMKLLHSLEVSDNISIKVNYKKDNAATGKIEVRQMNADITIVPEVEAEFIGGYGKMIDYLKENSMDKIQANQMDAMPVFSLTFIVNKEGKTEDIHMIETTGDQKIDQLLEGLIANMPEWKPAQNSEGESVKQKFEFSIGMMDGC